MIVSIAFVLALCVAAAPAQDLPVALQTDSFVTQLDHFKTLDKRTANITYHANFASYRTGGPFYIVVKDVPDRTTQRIESGLLVDIARKTNAALFTYDERFWGENIITEAADLESLQLMTPEQTLEDLATFSAHLRARYSHSAPIIVAGSGYGASTATWARKKYPQLFDAVWSSSGVFDLQVSTSRVIDTLQRSIQRASGNECSARLSEALWELNTLATSGDAEQIVEQLSVCSVGNLSDEQEIGNLYDQLLHSVINTVEYGNVKGVRALCDSLKAPAGGALKALGQWWNGSIGKGACVQVLSYADLVQAAKSEEWNRAALRQYTFSQCTQTALFMTTDNIGWLPNRIPLSYHQRKCEDIYGDDFSFAQLERVIAALATRYGSTSDQRVSKALYTNGKLDLWFSHGVVNSREPRTLVLNIENVARSADLTSINISDPIALNVAKRAIISQVVIWSKQ